MIENHVFPGDLTTSFSFGSVGLSCCRHCSSPRRMSLTRGIVRRTAMAIPSSGKFTGQAPMLVFGATLISTPERLPLLASAAIANSKTARLLY